jgi:hypothetical protein
MVITQRWLRRLTPATTPGAAPPLTAQRLRFVHGYQVPAARVNRDRNEFIWLLSYGGPEPIAEKEAAYYASAERAAVDPDPRQFIAQANRWYITPVHP